MKKIIFTLFLLQTLFCASWVAAQEPGAGSEPQITIRHDDDKTLYEYRINGVLTEIKVVPKVGPAYYLVPAEGGGWIREDKSQLLVPSWVIFRW